MSNLYYFVLMLAVFSSQVDASNEEVKFKDDQNYFLLPISIGESSDVTASRKLTKSFAGYLGIALVPNLKVLNFKPLAYVRLGTDTPLFFQFHAMFAEVGAGFLYTYSKDVYFQATIGRQTKRDHFLERENEGWESTKSRFTYNRFFSKSRLFSWNIGVLFEKAKYDNNDNNIFRRSRAGIEFGLAVVL